MAVKKCRNFQGVLYPDAENYNCQEVLQKLAQFSDYAYILHDMDTDDNGELKKPHYHWLVARDTPVALSVMVNTLGVPENSIEFCRSYRAFLRYMIHADDGTKHQYSPDDVQGIFKKQYLLGDSEKALVQLVIQEIEAGSIRSIQGLAAFAVSRDDWPSFRRNYSLFKDLLFERQRGEEVQYKHDWVFAARSAEELPVDDAGALSSEGCP